MKKEQIDKIENSKLFKDEKKIELLLIILFLIPLLYLIVKRKKPNYYVPYYNIVLLNTANAYSPSGIPYIFNNSSKIMNRFKLEIHVEYS